MFEDMTFNRLLEEGKAQISDDILKGEGSLVHNALAVMAFELEKLYIQADYIMRQADPARADYENLVTLAAARAIFPEEATCAQVRMVADADVPSGARFSLSAHSYVVVEELGDMVHSYLMQCEQPGSSSNGLSGKLTPITHVDGLTRAEITEILVAGRDADGRDALYRKYMNSFRESSFGGNVTEYKEHLTAFEGIGGAKIYPVWDGPGTVRCVLIGSDYRPVSGYLVEQIQQAMCPAPEAGYGIAPIGHRVTVVSVTGVEINLETQVTFRNGYSWEILREQISDAVREYLVSVCREWPSGGPDDHGTVYVSRTEAAILGVKGVKDVAGTRINGAEGNLVLGSDEVPIPGEVIGI